MLFAWWLTPFFYNRVRRRDFDDYVGGANLES
jgi:hypothetical protein